MQKSAEAVDKGWAYYSTVTLGVLVIVFGAGRGTLSVSSRKIMVLGYIIFSIINCVAIVRAQSNAIRWITLFNMKLQEITPPLPIEKISPFPVSLIVFGYFSICAVIIVTIFSANRSSSTIIPVGERN